MQLFKDEIATHGISISDWENNNNNILNLSSFIISEANYRLTCGYHDKTSFIYNYMSSTTLNHFFLTTSKYLPTFYTCILSVIFIIFLHATFYSCLAIYHVFDWANSLS